MGDFAADTQVAGGDGRYRARLSADWAVWGPLGGYVAAVALRALAAGSALPRPASFHCQFLSVGRFDDVTLEVRSLRRGRRSEALSVHMLQRDRPVLAGQGWMVDVDLPGLEHLDARAPDVPSVERLQSYADLADNYDDWYPVWRTIDGRPVVWHEGEGKPGPPVWHTWMRLFQTPPLDDPVLEAARSLMWLDLMMWNGAVGPHLPWPIDFIAPNLDLTAQFHAGAPDAEWLLCDCHAPVAGGGLVGCNGRVWSPHGVLLATGTSQLFCRPNPEPGQGA